MVANIITAVLGLAAVALIATSQPGGWAVLAAVLVAPVLMYRSPATSRRTVQAALSLGGAVAAIDYMSWRLGVVNWAAWWLSIPLLAAEVFGVLHALGISFTLWPRSPMALRPTTIAARNPIFVMVPTVDEGDAIVRRTLHAIKRARNRFVHENPDARIRIVVCNDGRVAGYDKWRELETLARSLDVECVTRTVPGGAKAGNIENARRELGITGRALIVIFDADQVPAETFFTRTVPYMNDPEVAWVQTGQYYENLENPVARWADDQQSIFYRLLAPGKSAQNAAFICGTNVIIRAEALDEIGGFPQSSVTEDYAASLELHERWKSVFVEGRLATGLGPMDLPAYFAQQNRWAIGTLSTIRSHLPRLLSPRRTGMTVSQRVQYLLASTHYLSGLKDLVFVMAPLIFLATGIPAVKGATLSDFLAHFLPYFLVSQGFFWWIAVRVTGVRGLLIAFASFPTLIGSLFTVITGKKVRFAVTSKSKTTNRQWSHLAPHVIGLIATVAVIAAVIDRGEPEAAVVVSLIWATYSGLCFLGVLWLGLADNLSIRRQRSTATATGRSILVSRVAPALFAISVVALVGVSTSITLKPQRSVTDVGLSITDDTLLVGMALPGGASADLAFGSSSALGLIGRTQTLSDSFDQEWADELVGSGAVPWVTLLLGDGSPTLATGLPAVSNGFHDRDLHRWASSMKDFGHPLYLTVFPHVDRDWALTSAVANGGIPQDVRPAWSRVREILDDAGATNVALVWAPADPAQDHSVAPQADEIDAVLLSLISYPSTDWGDPESSIGAVLAQHPGKPILLEVSASGPAREKALWLSRVGEVARSEPAVLALVYHEAGPKDFSEASRSTWSVTSDEWSEAIFDDLVAGVELTTLPFDDTARATGVGER